jgi:hypothetical protein
VASCNCGHSVLTTAVRKFFTLIILLNILGLDFAIMGVWTYARRYMATLVLGHLLTAVLVRNELFGRFLYLLVNKLFAKVREDLGTT